MKDHERLNSIIVKKLMDYLASHSTFYFWGYYSPLFTCNLLSINAILFPVLRRGGIIKCKLIFVHVIRQKKAATIKNAYSELPSESMSIVDLANLFLKKYDSGACGRKKKTTTSCWFQAN